MNNFRLNTNYQVYKPTKTIKMSAINRERDVQFPPQKEGYCLDYAIGESKELMDAKESKDGTVARKGGFREVPIGMPHIVCGLSFQPLDAQTDEIRRVIRYGGFCPVNVYNSNGMGHYIGVRVLGDGSIKWRLPIFTYEGQSREELKYTCDTVFAQHREAMVDLSRRFRALMPPAPASAPAPALTLEQRQAASWRASQDAEEAELQRAIAESKDAEDRRQAEAKAADDLATMELIAQLQAQDLQAMSGHHAARAQYPEGWF